MSNYTQAVQDIRQLAVRFQGITQVANALERIGSLEDAEREAKDRLSAARQAATDAEAVAKALAESRTHIANVEDKAQRIVQAGEAKAKDIIAQAEERGAGIIAEANAKANHVKAVVVAAQADLDALNAKIAAARAARRQILEGQF